MRSGIPDYVSDRLLARCTRDPGKRWTTAQMLARVPDDANPPHVVFDYSNTNYLLLGELIEKQTGRSYAEAVRGDLIGPAGLTRVAVQVDEPPRPPVARSGVTGAGARFLPSLAIASSAGAAGDIAADAADVAQWGYQLYGGHVLSPASLEAMLPSTNATYGLGTFSLERLTFQGLRVVGHAGNIAGYTSLLDGEPQHAISIALLATTDDADLDTVLDHVATVLLDTSAP